MRPLRTLAAGAFWAALYSLLIVCFACIFLLQAVIVGVAFALSLLFTR